MYFDTDKSLVIELNSVKGLVIEGAYNAEILNKGWSYMGISYVSLSEREEVSKVCAYLWGPDSYEV